MQVDAPRPSDHGKPASEAAPANAHFATTQWSLVLAACGEASPRAEQALAELCEAYWYPLYAFVRRQGRTPAEAEDLTQEFFVALIERRFLASTDPEKGRFRTFLLLCLKRFLSNQRDHDRAQKRGGGRRQISIDGQDAESRYRCEPSDADTPERLYERRWALALLDQVLVRLDDEYRRTNKTLLFKRLKSFLVADAPQQSYAALGEELRLSEGAVRVAVHRLRRRYGELLRAEVARTLERQGDVNEEIRALFAAFGQKR